MFREEFVMPGMSSMGFRYKGGGGSPDIIPMPERSEFVNPMTRQINAMSQEDNRRALQTGNFLKHDTFRQSEQQLAVGQRQGRTVMNSLMGRVIRDEDTRSKDAVSGFYNQSGKEALEAMKSQHTVDKYNTKNAGAAGLAQSGAQAVQANSSAYNQSQRAIQGGNQQRIQLGQIVNSQGSRDANWMVAAAGGAYGAYQGIRNQAQADEQLANAHSLGKSMYADSFNGGY